MRRVVLQWCLLSLISTCGCSSGIDCPNANWGHLYPDDGIVIFDNVKKEVLPNRTILSGSVRNVSSSDVCISQVYLNAWDPQTVKNRDYPYTSPLWRSVYNVPYAQRHLDVGESIEFIFDAGVDDSAVGWWQYYVYASFN
jgi:hypothetical protein